MMDTMKHRAIRVTDEQDAALEKIAAAHGLSVTDLFRKAASRMGEEVGISFPLNHKVVGSGLNQPATKKKKPAPKKKGRAS